MATSVTPNGDPFRGGSFTGTTVPQVNGAIGAANTAGTLVGGVAGSTPMLARNNRGSNITVPYARVVLHPSGRTALPAPPKDQDPTQITLGKPAGDMIVETEFLYSGRVAFILGRRAAEYGSSGVDQILGYEAMEAQAQLVNSRTAQALHQFAVGGVDQHTFQRMCSFEYLERYFYYVMRTKSIDLAGPTYPDAASLPAKYKSATGKAFALPLNNIDGQELIDEIATKENGTAVADSAKVALSGIYAKDDGPFLRGYTVDRSFKPFRRNQQKASMAIGDTLAFEVLERELKNIGALDWAPDGIVLSKLDSGGYDRLADDGLDARDGQLYNVTIGGPAITSSWTGDPSMEVLPLDKVFILLVGDVIDGKDPAEVKSDFWDVDAAERAKAASTQDPTKFYDALFEAHIKADDRDYATDFRATAATASAKQTITNIRVMRATSSQMVAHSMPGKRMGLKIGADGGEYILGGWCIGTVLDSAASRAMPDGMALMGAVKRQKSQNAAQVSVDIISCSGDELYRKYMNRGSLGRAGVPSTGTLRTRYTPLQRPLDPFNRPATARRIRTTDGGARVRRAPIRGVRAISVSRACSVFVSMSVRKRACVVV